MRIALILLALSLAVRGIAQNNLSGSRQSGAFTYVYRISADQAFKLTTKPIRSIPASYLVQKQDSFLSESKMPVLSPGNYLLLKAVDNQLLYKVKTIGDLQLKIISNNYDLAVFVHNKTGQAIKDARVHLGKKRLDFNPATNYYALPKTNRKGLLRVVHNDVAWFADIKASQLNNRYQRQVRKIGWQRVKYYFPVQYITWLVNRIRYPDQRNSYGNFFNSQTRHEQKYRGYMVFSKPIYRPGDTVRLKAFISSKKAKPVDRKMIVRLSDYSLGTDTIIGSINPYRKGGYDFEFVLSQKLDLELDNDYLVTIEELESAKYDLDEYDGDLDEEEYALKRKVVMRGKFDYEEYELMSTKFDARAEKQTTHKGETNAIFFKATDENGLPVLDGRVKVTITPDREIRYHQPYVFLADTLFTTTIPLEPIGETRFAIPDSVFPPVSLGYRVNCNFLNSNNESREQSLRLRFENRSDQVKFSLRKDSIYIEKSFAGTETIIALASNGDTLQRSILQLPASLKLNPYAVVYKTAGNAGIDSKTTSTSFASSITNIISASTTTNSSSSTTNNISNSTTNNIHVTDSFDMKNGSNLVAVTGMRTIDSLYIAVSNPHQLPAWYSLFAGNKIVKRGQADTVIYLGKTQTKNDYHISLQYLFGNKVYTSNYTYPLHDKKLVIDIKEPDFVYPGQTAGIEINLKDVAGNPVESADITAYAFTSKFEDVHDPSIPYFGKTYPNRHSRNNYADPFLKEKTQLEALNWIQWSRELGLDTIEYYKFLHPAALYSNHQPAPDSITQISPFVTKAGALQKIHMLYIDDEPVFFSRSQDLARYSFAVSPGRHSLRIRTAKEMIYIDSIDAVKGMKTWFSVDPDSTAARVRVYKREAVLSPLERDLMSKYMILIQSDYGEHLVYTRQWDRLRFISDPLPGYINQQRMVAVGPFKQTDAELVVNKDFTQGFEVEGGYQYIIRPGLIKQKQLPYQFAMKGKKKKQHPYSPLTGSAYLEEVSMQPHFRDLVLTEKEIDSLWNNYLYLRSLNHDLFTNSYSDRLGKGRLEIELLPGAQSNELLVKQVIIFRTENPDFIRIYRGGMHDLGHQQPGNYRLFLLMKNGDYFVRDSVLVKKGGLNFYRVVVDNIKRPDSTSLRIAKIIEDRKLYSSQWNQQQLDQIKESFNAVHLDAASFTREVSGRVIDSEGKAIQGAVINIKSSSIGTSSGASGFFGLKAPEECTLVISAVGYSTVEIRPGLSPLEVIMKLSSNNLEEVVVVGYGVQRKAALSASVTTINSSSIVGKVAGIAPGIKIRGLNNVDANTTPLIVIDGVPFTGKLEDLDMSKFAEPVIVASQQAEAIYGAKAANGAIVITSAKSSNQADEPLQDARNSIRRNFRDDAYWQPRLLTDKNGNAKFSVTFPDDITNWRTFVIAMADKKRTGFRSGNIRSFKTLSGILSLPNFVVEGDSVNIIAKAQNYLGDTVSINRVFRINDSVVSKNDFRLVNARIDTFAVRVSATQSKLNSIELLKKDFIEYSKANSIELPKTDSIELLKTNSIESQKADSIEFSYTIQKPDGYADGELRKIEIMKAGVLETNGFFAALDGDTSFVLPVDPLKGEVTIHAETGAIPVLLEEIETIRKYEYYCNEQMASKLKALLIQKSIYDQLKSSGGDSTINGLKQSATERNLSADKISSVDKISNPQKMPGIATKFTGEKTILELIRRLEKSKTPMGFWGWWPGNQELGWISTHVLEALLLAERAGYKNTMNKQAQIDLVVYRLEKQSMQEKLSSLRLLQLLGSKFDQLPMLDTLHKYRYRLPLQDQLDLMLMRQSFGLPILLDSAVQTSHRTMMGNIYFGTEGYNIVRNSVQHTIRMYKLMRASKQNYTTELKKIRNFFFEQRRESNWRNTYESSQIIETMLPDLLAETGALKTPTMEIKVGGTSPAIKQNSSSDTGLINKFPYTYKFTPAAGTSQPSSKTPTTSNAPTASNAQAVNNIPSTNNASVSNISSTSISITKKGAAPIYLTSYQKTWNTRPSKVDSIFAVSSHFERNGNRLTSLTAGQSVSLQVEVNVRSDGDYVMIEIPIPAGCSYESKPQPWGNNEVHREYFKNKVSIFCSALAKGRYTFTVPLMPRFTGVFVLNPAKVELMYFPVLFGREGMKTTVIQ